MKGAKGLAVAGDGAQLTWQKVIRRPGTADRDFTVFQLLGGGRIAVLVLFHALGVDQVGDVDQHALGRDFLAADFFLQRVKQLVHLDRQRARFGLAFALAGGFYLQLRQVVAADGVWQFDIDHRLAQRAIANHQLDVHFGLSPQLGDAHSKSPPVDPDGLAERVIAVENGSELERQDGGIAETVADYPRVLNRRLLVQFTGCVVKFADDHREFTTGIAQNRSAVHSLNAL